MLPPAPRHWLPPLWVAGVAMVPLLWWIGSWLFGLIPLWWVPVALFAFPALRRRRRSPRVALALTVVLVAGLLPFLPCEAQPYSDAIPPEGPPPAAPSREAPLIVGTSGLHWTEGEMTGRFVDCPPTVFGVGLVWLAALAGLSLWMQRPRTQPPATRETMPQPPE